MARNLCNNALILMVEPVVVETLSLETKQHAAEQKFIFRSWEHVWSSPNKNLPKFAKDKLPINFTFRDSLTCVSRIAAALKTSLRICTCRIAMAISLSKRALVHIFAKFSIAGESFLTSTGEASVRVLAFSISMATGRRQTFIDVWKQNDDIRWRQSQFFFFSL